MKATLSLLLRQNTKNLFFLLFSFLTLLYTYIIYKSLKSFNYYGEIFSSFISIPMNEITSLFLFISLVIGLFFLASLQSLTSIAPLHRGKHLAWLASLPISPGQWLLAHSLFFFALAFFLILCLLWATSPLFPHPLPTYSPFFYLTLSTILLATYIQLLLLSLFASHLGTIQGLFLFALLFLFDSLSSLSLSHWPLWLYFFLLPHIFTFPLYLFYFWLEVPPYNQSIHWLVISLIFWTFISIWLWYKLNSKTRWWQRKK